ncbi:family 16 glycoside hydrolase [Fimbriiglobus ruber]|uniref:3-keto-alpha-glucoside-1,2-lyase/3-keto-2-hydroxy-glucal hydratase domain-containing protein n=1 Tax=Fimbriiglobus ruber TaxID=1908690 RepID=A0A225DMQ8_9BACT|nr:family 16 glycoside hydrolase [Fimbriiglobus ruber]OWK37477.1 hypothetical protein FRUB_06597 [Fimbriiglobus ruber]
MRCLTLLTLVFVATAAAVPAADPSAASRFEKADLGKLPPGWVAAKTGQGEGSVWVVVADDTAPGKTGYCLAQTAEGPNPFFNLCVRTAGAYQDVAVKVQFKAVAGKLDQGGGVVWRYQDADNYYIARMNPLEDNFRVYKVVAGKRTQLDTKERLKVPVGEWYTIAVTMAGSAIECRLDGEKHLSATDDTFKTAGKVGLWSKADARTRFDQFAAAAIEK